MEKIILGGLGKVLGNMTEKLGTETTTKIKNGGNIIMKTATGMNMEDAIKAAGLNEEQVKEKVVEPSAAEEAKIMEDINATVDGEAQDATVIEDILSQHVSGLLLTNDLVLERNDLGFTDSEVLNKLILAILLKLKSGFKMSGLIDGEKEDAIKAFLMNLSNKTNELKILATGGIEFLMGDKKVFETCLPKIIPAEGVFMEISTKNTPFKMIDDEMIDDIIESFSTR